MVEEQYLHLNKTGVLQPRFKNSIRIYFAFPLLYFIFEDFLKRWIVNIARNQVPKLGTSLSEWLSSKFQFSCYWSIAPESSRGSKSFLLLWKHDYTWSSWINHKASSLIIQGVIQGTWTKYTNWLVGTFDWKFKAAAYSGKSTEF